jgi:hypothetical protein
MQKGPGDILNVMDGTRNLHARPPAPCALLLLVIILLAASEREGFGLLKAVNP